MRPAPKPKLNLFFTLLLALAYFISPKAHHEWLEAMHFEVGFIPGFSARGRFLLAALGLACKWRFETLRPLKLPHMLTLAGASAAALFVLIIFLPQTPPPQQKVSLEPVPEVRAELESSEAATVSARESSDQVLGEASQSVAASPNLPEPPSVVAAPAPNPAISSGSELSLEDSESAAIADAATELSFDTAENSFGLRFVAGTMLSLKASQTTELLLIQGEIPLFEGRLETEAELNFEPPATLISSDFSRLELYQNNQKLDIPADITRLELLINEP